MVKDRWIESEFTKYRTALEQCVYGSRLLGQDPELVLHGGGNTSVKDEWTDLFGERQAVIYIKGSGHDLGKIEINGFPGLKLKYLQKLRGLSALSDLDMVNELRGQMTDSRSPDPSVEALLHAFIPHRFVYHTHADAILTITNQTKGEELIKTLFGKRVGIVPYVMPGFRLAKLCIEMFESNPEVEGIVLLKHGIFSFGESSLVAYRRMISLVQLAEEFILSQMKTNDPKTRAAPSVETVSEWMQMVRTSYLKRGFSTILNFDDSEEALAFVDRSDLVELSQQGPLTPDHVIRTKRLALVLNPGYQGEPDRAILDRSLDDYAKEYRAYFQRNCDKRKITRQILDTLPRVILIPKVGAIYAGATYKDATITRDIYQHTLSVLRKSTCLGTYTALDEVDIFDVEYWSLEQAKLKLRPKSLPLTGKVALITGGASGIGLAISRLYLEMGAITCIADINDSQFEKLNSSLPESLRAGNHYSLFKCDVSQRSQVRNVVLKVVAQYGGLDILVVNAGVFPPSHLIEQISGEEWSQSIDVNLGGAFHVVSESLPWLKKQGVGGDIIVIASKNVPAPGREAAAYSVAKAGQVQLARVCALEAASHGIRVNTLHPHLILDTGIWTEETLKKRASAYGMTPDEYKKNNLLKTELSSQDVAKAALALASGYFDKTTGAQISVDGGTDRTL